MWKNPMIYPVWEVVNELKMAVIFHSGSLGISFNLPLDARRAAGFNAKFGQPFLLDQPERCFPDIRFIIAHGGYFGWGLSRGRPKRVPSTFWPQITQMDADFQD